jgi:hypothetical protein
MLDQLEPARGVDDDDAGKSVGYIDATDFNDRGRDTSRP